MAVVDSIHLRKDPTKLTLIDLLCDCQFEGSGSMIALDVSFKYTLFSVLIQDGMQNNEMFRDWQDKKPSCVLWLDYGHASFWAYCLLDANAMIMSDNDSIF